MSGDDTSPRLRRPSESEFGAGIRILFTTRIGLSIVSVIVLILLAPVSGFCLFQLRFLSDEDFFNAAIDDVLRQSVHIIELDGGEFTTSSPRNQIPYRDREEFRRLNPDCCTIVPYDRFRVTGFHQLLGLAARSVRVKYKFRYVNDTGRTALMDAVAQRAVSNCGHVLNAGH